MSTVSEIIEAVKKLPEADKSEFLQRLAEVDFEEAWDRQIKADVKAGKLDRLAEEALEEFRAGKTRPFPPDAQSSQH